MANLSLHTLARTIVSLNEIDEPVSASLAIVGNAILIRGESHLYSIETKYGTLILGNEELSTAEPINRTNLAAGLLQLFVEPISNQQNFLGNSQPWVPATFFDDQLSRTSRTANGLNKLFGMSERHNEISISVNQ